MFLTTSPTAFGAVLLVPTADLPDIRSALSQSRPGDTIKIAAGVHRGPGNCDILVDKESLTIVGSDTADAGGRTVLDCEYKSRCISIIGVRAAIKNLNLQNGQAPGLAMGESTDGFISRRTQGSVGSFCVTRNLPRRFRSGRKRVLVGLVGIYAGDDGSLESMRFSSSSMFTTKRRISRTQGKEGKAKTADTTLLPNLSPFQAIPLRGRENLTVDEAPIAQCFGGCLLVEGSLNLTLTDVVVSGGRAFNGSGAWIANSLVNLDSVVIRDNGIIANSSDDNVYGSIFLKNISGVVRNSAVLRNFIVYRGRFDVGGAGAAVLFSRSVTFDNFTCSENRIFYSSEDNADSGIYAAGEACLFQIPAFASPNPKKKDFFLKVPFH